MSAVIVYIIEHWFVGLIGFFFVTSETTIKTAGLAEIEM